MANTRIVLDDRKLRQIIENIANERVERRVIHDGVEYGIYQELTDRGHPSLVPAFERVVKGLPKAIGAAIETGTGLNDLITKAAFDIQSLWAGDVNVDTGAYKNSIKVD